MVAGQGTRRAQHGHGKKVQAPQKPPRYVNEIFKKCYEGYKGKPSLETRTVGKNILA